MDKYLVPLETPCVYYDESFLSHDNDESSATTTSTSLEDLYQDLWKNTSWEKTAKINRWVSLLHNEALDEDYKYRDAPSSSNDAAKIVGFPKSIQQIQQKVQEWYHQRTGRKVVFNVCLLNFYENGEQRIGWHSDREEIGRDTPIASISLGATRTLLIRSKQDGVKDRASISMKSGSLVVMENICQHQYLHSVPKELDVTQGRINLTFRCKTTSTAGEAEHERRDNWLENIIDGTAPAPEGWSLAQQQQQPQHAINNATTSSTLLVFGDGVQRGTINDPTKKIHLLAKTNMGAEGYCAAEIKEKMSAVANMDDWEIVAQPLGMDGYVACAGAAEMTNNSLVDIQSALLNLRAAHHLLKYHTHFDLNDLVSDEFPEAKLIDGESLYQYFKQQLVDEHVTIDSLEDLKSSGGTFRTTCERIGGPHAFRAPEVEREIGGAMSEYYTHYKPKMEDYDINVRVDVVGTLVVVGTQLNVTDLSKDRHFIKFRNIVTIKANLAYAMVRCAGIRPGMTIADPFCGSGTLLLEALEVCNKRLAKCIGLDVSRKTIEGARDNAIAEGYTSTEICEFICSDARGLRRHLADDSIDAIISNLPWGIKTGHNSNKVSSFSDLQTIYEIFLRTAWYALKDGARVVVFVLRGLQLTRIVRKLGGRYRLLSVNVIRTSNNLPCIVVMEKLAVDQVRESVKGQLAHLNKYVNVSPELYEAIHMENIND